MASFGEQQRDAFRKIAYQARSIAGQQFGLRPHTVALLLDYEGGDQTLQPITEANGQPPKVVWKSDEDNPRDGGIEDWIEIGPITPSFPGGGTDLDSLTSDVEVGKTRYLLITGPRHPDGAKYRITNVDAQSALHYVIRAQSESRAMAGLANGF